MVYAAAFAGLGAGLACYSNVLRKLPMMRRPWEHVAYAAFGAYVGSQVPAFKEHQKRELEKTVSEREQRLEERAARIAAKKAAQAAEQ